ncbi:MAG: TOBE domain-containing protein [Sulfurimonadaceae bacterium]|jgi:molybdate transport system regulatory protein|nr:TOBE domain-containing protein [Arcobacteraceae bacterium]
MKKLFDVDGNIWIKKDNRGFIGKGRIELLQNIQIYGSISKAAKQMKMSYKAAWDSVDIMNKLSNKPLVTKVTGGVGGGGTVITAYAKELIRAYEEVSLLYRNYFETLSNSFNANLLDDTFEEPVFCRLTGTIKEKLNINDNYEITIQTKSNQLLTAIESKKFVVEKSLEIGDEINCLIETNNIVLNKTKNKNSARNILKAKVLKINDDGINSTIKLDCGKDEVIFAKITTASCHKLEIKVDDILFASFKAYSINII